MASTHRRPSLLAAASALLTALCGIALWKMPLGEPLVLSSYDYLFRFVTGGVSNKVVVIQMDNDSYDLLKQNRDQPWDRSWHARLLEKLADDECPLVVFDVFFKDAGEPAVDGPLLTAMGRLSKVVLMSEQAELAHQDLVGARPLLPAAAFLQASRTNWGVAFLDPNADLDQIVRRHWPCPSPGPYPSLPWSAALLDGARLSENPQERWIRYYGTEGGWTRISYSFALTQAPGFFRDAIVFIGNNPKTTLADSEIDEFQTPYTRWTGETAGGVEIQAAIFLNLVNGDWLRRAPKWAEAVLLICLGIAFGWGLLRLRPWMALLVALASALLVSLAAVSMSAVTNYWFPWLVVSAGQLPFAFCSSFVMSRFAFRQTSAPDSLTVPLTERMSSPQDLPFPDAPDYELIHPPFGEGAYGKVWVARNAVGQWQALKAVYQTKFGADSTPYEREFRGIKNYKPISHKHPSLLRVDFVSRKKREGYFYYVMELGDGLTPGWESQPEHFRPRDLASVRQQQRDKRLSIPDCVSIVSELAEGLDFLHGQGLTHRDIKPSNIIFVNNRPKLADVGLVVETSSSVQDVSLVGTPGYMPPASEPLGTVAADIYGLGMVLYVIATGYPPESFPEIPTALADTPNVPSFMKLNAIILKACQPDWRQRYSAARDLKAALGRLL